MFYDRYNGRVLDLGEYTFPLGIVNWVTYRVPGPRAYFFEHRGPHGWRATVPTAWIYSSNELRGGQWIGRVPSEPNPGQVPPSRPPLTTEQTRSYNLSLRHRPATKNAKKKWETAVTAPRVSEAPLREMVPGTGPLMVIVLEGVFAGLSSRQIWNSLEVDEMRQQHLGPRLVTYLNLQVFFEFSSAATARSAWLFLNNRAQLSNARIENLTPTQFAELNFLVNDIWDDEQEDEVTDYATRNLPPAVGTSSQAATWGLPIARATVPDAMPMIEGTQTPRVPNSTWTRSRSPFRPPRSHSPFRRDDRRNCSPAHEKGLLVLSRQGVGRRQDTAATTWDGLMTLVEPGVLRGTLRVLHAVVIGRGQDLTHAQGRRLAQIPRIAINVQDQALQDVVRSRRIAGPYGRAREPEVLWERALSRCQSSPPISQRNQRRWEREL
ncbi:hypothetical protein C8F01DRAFT_1085717 [Mycena amicta]|nr:hypothetical protein C8F01DRAFT_1085717 [Mycena amicta]